LHDQNDPSAGDLLRDVAVYDLAAHIVTVATERCGCRVGLYVVDIGGGELRRVAGEVDRLEVRPLDLVEAPPNGLAVLAQHLVLVVDLLGAAEDVGRVGVLGDETKRLLLASATDHDRDPGA